MNNKNMLYFAKFVETDSEIAVFATEENRNNWVNYNDEFSLLLGTTVENCTFERVMITPEEVEELAGIKLTYPKEYTHEAISAMIRDDNCSFFTVTKDRLNNFYWLE